MIICLCPSPICWDTWVADVFLRDKLQFLERTDRETQRESRLRYYRNGLNAQVAFCQIGSKTFVAEFIEYVKSETSFLTSSQFPVLSAVAVACCNRGK